MNISTTPSSEINEYISERLINQKEPSWSTTRKLTDIALKVIFGGGIGVLATIPFAPLSVHFSKRLNIPGEKAIGYILATANSSSYFFITLWANLENVEGLTTPKTQLEKKITQKDNLAYLASSYFVAVTLGLVSQVPFAYLAYDQNKQNLLMPILIIVADSSFPILSVNRAIKSITTRIFSKSKNKQTQHLLKNFDRFLSNRIDWIAKGGTTDTELTLKEGFSHKKIDSASKLIDFILQQESQNSLTPPTPLQKVKTGARFLGYGGGMSCALSELIVLWVLSNKGWDSVIDSTPISRSLSVVVILVQVYLLVQVYGETCADLSEKSIEAITCSTTKSAHKTENKWFKAAKISIFAQSLLTFGPSMETAMSYFKDKGTQYYLGITTSIGIACLTLHSMQDILKRFVNARAKENSEQEKLLKFKSQLEALSALLKSANQDAITKFFLNFNDKQLSMLSTEKINKADLYLDLQPTDTTHLLA